MINLTYYYAILTYFSLGLGIFLLLVVYLSNPKAALNRLFIIFTLSILFWATTPFFIKLFRDAETMIFYYKINHAMGILSAYSAYILVTRLFARMKRNPFLENALTIVLVLGILIAFSPFVIIGVENTAWGLSPVLGWGRFILLPMITLIACFVFSFLFKGYKSFNQTERSQFNYFLTGFVIMIVLALPSLVVLPLFGLQTAKYWHIASLGAPILISFSALAIFKKQAFNAKVILTDTLVGLYGIASLALPILSSGTTRILSLLLFIFFLIIGYSLVRYTHREVEQKEVLEEKVRERTKEIEKRKHDLEKFYSLTVGRELKMVELKQNIRELEEKVKKG